MRLVVTNTARIPVANIFLRAKALLASVFTNDPEHPDVSLNNETGWSLSYGFSRTMIFENVETGDGPWHMKEIAPELALSFWSLLSTEQLAELRSQARVNGYGN